MDFRKTESDQMKLRANENDFVAFVRTIMEFYGKMAVKRHIDFQLLSRDESLMVWFDVNVMDKVLFNLLSNAFKFTPDNGKIQLMIFVDAFENTVKLTVEDTGKGMTEEEVKHVFDAFYQGQDAHFTGTGLGLSLSKALVKLHGGKISVQSTHGKGSRFIVALPLGKEHLLPEQMVLEPSRDFYTEGVLFSVSAFLCL